MDGPGDDIGDSLRFAELFCAHPLILPAFCCNIILSRCVRDGPRLRRAFCGRAPS